MASSEDGMPDIRHLLPKESNESCFSCGTTEHIDMSRSSHLSKEGLADTLSGARPVKDFYREDPEVNEAGQIKVYNAFPRSEATGWTWEDPKNIVNFPLLLGKQIKKGTKIGKTLKWDFRKDQV